MMNERMKKLLALLLALSLTVSGLALAEYGEPATDITGETEESDVPAAEQPAPEEPAAEEPSSEPAAGSATPTDADEPVHTVTYGRLSVPSDSTYIDLGDITVKNYDNFIAFLEQLPKLEKVDMFSTLIEKKNIDLLAERFPDIEFGWTMYLKCEKRDHKIRTDTTAFGCEHNNRIKGHTSTDLSILKYCTKLEALDIGHNYVTDLSFLYDLPSLKVLIVACNHITDITPIGSLKELQYLEIFKNKITDISCLANCTELLDLNICFNYITDYSPIYGLNKLERLWVYNSNNYSASDPVDKNAVAELKRQLPNTYIDSTHYSTLGGWREHPRYFVLRKMFPSSTYYPFDDTTTTTAE